MENVEALKRGPKYFKEWANNNKHFNDILNFSNSDLKGLNLYDLYAKDNSFYIIDLSGANFENSDLSNARLELCDFSNANFNNAILNNASFRKSKCINTSFQKCELKGSSFFKAKLDGCDFSFSDLESSNFEIKSGKDINLFESKINNISLASLFDDDLSYFALCLAKNLDKVHLDSQNFVQNFVTEAFSILHLPEIEVHKTVTDADGVVIFDGIVNEQIRSQYNPEYFDKVLNRIKLLNGFYFGSKLTNEIITISNILNTELISYLKSNPKHIYNIHWRVFEELIAEILKSFGWHIELTSKTKDGGYDIFGICKDISGLKHNWLIECKKWGEQNLVGIDVVRALYGVKTDLKVGNALLATTSFFTQGVNEFKASHYDFQTVDFNGIVEWLNLYKKNEDGNLWISKNELHKK